MYESPFPFLKLAKKGKKNGTKFQKYSAAYNL